MNDHFTEQEKNIVATSVSEENDITSGSIENETAKIKITKKKIFIIGGIIIAVIAIALIIFIPSKFERVQSKCVDIAGVVQGTEDYFIIDTNFESVFIPNAKERALEAIRYANEELGFTGAVYESMLNTSAIMGRQSEENDKYKVSWTYHPKDGLEVTYEKK